MKIKYLFQIDYYRYLLSNINRLQLKDYLFFDPLTLGTLFVLVVCNFLIYFPGYFEIHFPNLDIEIYVIETLIRTIAVFIGIVFSFVVLSFNIFYRNFGRFVFLSFFKNRGVKVLFTLFIMSITFMIYSISYLKEITESNSYANSLFTISISFCIVTIVSIFPVVIVLLRESQNRGNIGKLIKQLNEDWVISYYENVIWDKSTSFKHYQKDPIAILTEIGTVAIKEFDQITLNTIITECIEYMDTLIKGGQKRVVIEPKQFYSEFRKLNSNLYHVATKERNENALFLLINSRYDLEKLIFTNLDKVKLTDYNDKYLGWTFNTDIQIYFNRAIQFNEDEVCRRLIDNQRDFLTEIVNNILPSRKFNYDPNDWNSFRDEVSMVSGALREVDIFLSSIINTKKYHLYQNISNLFSTMDSACVDSSNPSDSKIYLLNIFNNYKLDNFEKFIRNNDIRNLPYLFYPFHSSNLTHVSQKLDCSIPFISSLKAIDILFANNKLNLMVINSLKAKILSLIRELDKNPKHKEHIKLAINKFNHLRSLISENDNDDRKNIYLKLEHYLQFILTEVKRNIPKEKGVIDLINEYLNNFVLKDKFKNELESKGYLSNDSFE